MPFFVLQQALLSAAVAEMSYISTSLPDNRNMCAGVEQSPGDMASFTAVELGPCTSATPGPIHGKIRQEVVGLAWFKWGDTDPANVEVIEGWDDDRNGYRTYAQNLEARSPETGDLTGRYAEFHAGAYLGNPSTAGGYVSVASYLMQDGSTDAAVAKLRSPHGLEVTNHEPDAETYVCMTELGADGKCSNTVRYTEGDYKFSIYGAVFGNPAQWEVPTHQPTGQKMDKFAVRMSLELKGAGTNSFATMGADVNAYFNDDQRLTLDTLGYTAVKKMTLVFAEGDGTTTEVDFDFPQKYNVGAAGLQTGPQGKSYADPLLPTATKEVHIVVSKNPAKEYGIFVDYIFDGSDFETLRDDGTGFGNYFLYDPTVTERKEQAPATLPASPVVSTMATGAPIDPGAGDQTTTAPATTVRGRSTVDPQPPRVPTAPPSASSGGHKVMDPAAGLLAIVGAAAALL
jgi:hypothetical protein